MGMTRGNNFFNGNTGRIWVNGNPVLTCYKAKIIKKNKYESVPALVGNGEIRIPTGHTIEVSFSFRKTGKEDFLELFNGETDIIVSEMNISGVITKRTKASGITFDEETLASFEKNKVGEVELTGQAETYQILQ